MTPANLTEIEESLIDVEYIESGTFQGGEEATSRAGIKHGEECVVLKKAYVATLVEAVKAMQWQPIETAPKDQLIDIWITGGIRWCGCYYDRICDEWRTSRPSGNLITINASEVTHWMPLPQPPPTENERKGE